MTGTLEVVQRPDYQRFSPRALARYYRGQLGADIAILVAYRGEVAVWLLATIIPPLVLIPVWQAIAGPTGSIEGYSAAQFVTYFVFQSLIGHLTFNWLMWDFERRIRAGEFTPLLIRPQHPVHKDVCATVSYKMLSLVGLVPALAVVSLVYGADFSSITPVGIAAGVAATIGAMCLRFVIEWMMGLIAFWMTKTAALNQLYGVALYFLAGSFAPLAALPTGVQQLAFVLPFQWMVAFPVECLTGRRTGTDLLIGFGMQLAWIIVALVAMRVVWPRAVSRYSAVGS